MCVTPTLYIDLHMDGEPPSSVTGACDPSGGIKVNREGVATCRSLRLKPALGRYGKRGLVHGASPHDSVLQEQGAHPVWDIGTPRLRVSVEAGLATKYSGSAYFPVYLS